jgi:hypothetical protein
VQLNPKFRSVATLSVQATPAAVPDHPLIGKDVIVATDVNTPDIELVGGPPIVTTANESLQLAGIDPATVKEVVAEVQLL